jgi:hypothetical protein
MFNIEFNHKEFLILLINSQIELLELKHLLYLDLVSSVEKDIKIFI